MKIRARNNLQIPIRLTLARSGDEILITIDKEGVLLKDFYRVCIDTDLAPDKTWSNIGFLQIQSSYHVSVQGVEP